MYGNIIVYLSLLPFLVLLQESTYLCSVERQTGLYVVQKNKNSKIYDE